MAKVMSTGGKSYPQLPPSDRELALRAQIKTGWSTYRRCSSHTNRQNLSQQEMRIIQEVVERAQALERMEEIRIGLLMLKHKQMVDNCRGDGVTTCRICNRDFTSQRSSRPEPIQYCQDCQMVMCSRCKNVCKMVSGQDRMLCTVCYEERELWKKSGAWLDHSEPSVSIPEKDLEEIQQQQVKTTKYTIGRKRESTLLVNPYQCEEESDDDDDDNALNSSTSATKSRIQFSRSAEPSPILDHRASPIPKAKQLEAAFSAGHRSSSDSEDQRNFPTNLKSRSFSRKANLSRKGGISGANRERLLKYRERANSRSNSPGGSHSRSTSPSSNTEMGGADRDASGNGVPSIKVSAIASRYIASSLANRNTTPDSEGESPKKRVIRQMHNVSSTESESIQVSTRSSEPLNLARDGHMANRSPVAGRSPSPHAGKTKAETSEEAKAFIEEFKKVKSPPQKPPPVNESKPVDDEFKKVKKSGSLPRTSPPTDQKSEDEFHKVKSIAPPPQKPPPVNESKPADDEFKKIKTAGFQRKSLPTDQKNEDEFKKVKSTAPPPQKPPPVMDASAKPSDEEFRKVKSTAPPSKPVPVLDGSKTPVEDEFRRVKPSASPSKPPPVLEASKAVQDEFKKIKSSSLERAKRTPEKEPKTRTLPTDVGLSAGKESEGIGGEFKKVSPRSSPFNSGGSDGKSAQHGMHSSPLRSAVRSGSVDAAAKISGGEEDSFKRVSLPKSEPKPAIANRRKVLPDLPTSGPPPVVSRGAAPPLSQPPPTVPPRETPSVATSTATPPSHVPRQIRSLPASGGPPPPLPAKRSSSSNTASAVTSSGSNLGADLPMLAEAGKQSSITSVGSSIMSEHSTTYDIDSGMASPSSLGSSDSVDTTGRQSFSSDKQQTKEMSSSEAVGPSADGFSSRGFDRPSSLSRRNASRINKRPPPKPRLDEEEEGQTSSQSQEQGEEIGPVITRPRARSRVIRKRPQGMAGGVEDSNPSDSSHTTLDDEPESQFQQRRTRTRSSAVTSADRVQARAASSRTESGEHGRVSGWKPDGAFGSVRMTLQYSETATTLAVTIHGCKGLRAMDSNGKSDPYVNLFLQPGNKRQRFQTKVIPKNLNPRFDETFSFTDISIEAMEKKKLCVVVMDYDDFSKDDLIGATQVSLYQVLHCSTHELCIKRLLDDRSVLKSDAIVVERGSLHLRLNYSTTKKGLVVTVIAASNIAGHLPRGECECLVKCYWTTRMQCMKGKTQVARKSNNPEFNETLFFPLSVHELIYSSLTVSVWEHKSFKDKVLGEIQFKSSAFWKTFVENPTQQVQDWYPLEEAVLSPSHKNATKVPVPPAQ